MQRSNLILFIVLASILLGGWYLAVQMFPPEPETKKIAKAKDDPVKKIDKKVEIDPKLDPPKKPVENVKKNEEPNKKEPVKVEPAQTTTLGGPGFHLTVDVTRRGAAVRKVTLDHFKKADWRGRPTEGDFEIIQDDEFAPSFRMYHYLGPKEEKPVFGLGEKNWDFEEKKLLPNDVQEARYSTTVPDLDHIKIVKTYRLAPTDYHVTMLLEIHDTRTDKDAPALPFRYQLTGAQGIPIEGEWYTAIFRNAFIGLVDKRESLWRKTEESARISPRKGGDRFPEGTRGDNRLQYAGVANQYFGVMIVVDDKQPARGEGGVDKDKILAWARPTLESTELVGEIVKIADDSILFKDKEKDRQTIRYTLLPRTKKHLKDLELNEGDKAVLSFYDTPDGKKIASWVRLGETLKPQFDDITVRVNSEVIELAPRDTVKHQFMLYHGPVKAALLAQFKGEKAVPSETVERYTHTLHLRSMTDYASDNWFGWVSSKIYLTDLIILFTRLMHWLLNLLHYVFGYGFSIIVLTVIVRGAMFPISRKQALFSIKMQALAPELKKLQEKFPDDPQARTQAQQEFYRKNGINPLGSCWPVFLQMPIFLGLYFALQESIHFRLADFLWMKNLAAPDMLIRWGEQIPVISSPDHASGILGALYLGPYFNILPIVACVFMMIQQTQTMPPPTDEQQAMQQKMLKYMTIFFGIMFYKVAAGLCIYFIASSLWGLAERKLLPKKKPVAEAPGGSAGALANGKPTPGSSATAITASPPKWKGKNSKKEKEIEKPKEALTTVDKLKAMWREILKQAEKK